MNKATVLVLVLGLMLSTCTRARAVAVVPTRWVVVLTLTDLATGKELEKKELDPQLQFDDLRQCKSFVSRVGPIPSSDHFGGVLTCRKIDLTRDHGRAPASPDLFALEWSARTKAAEVVSDLGSTGDRSFAFVLERNLHLGAIRLDLSILKL